MSQATIQVLAEERHRVLWDQIDPSHQRAKVFVEASNKASWYAVSDREIYIRLTADDLDDDVGTYSNWPKWEEHLVHELAHEYQQTHKPFVDQAALALFDKFKNCFGQDGTHGPNYFAAIIAISPHIVDQFGDPLPIEDIIRRV